MACGLGICFSCVTRVRITSSNVTSTLTRSASEGGEPSHALRPGIDWDYRRVCLDGPVFDAASLVWEDRGSGN